MINLPDYIKQEIRRLQEFEAWWISQNKTHPDMYPLSLAEGDWDEQVFFYSEGH